MPLVLGHQKQRDFNQSCLSFFVSDAPEWSLPSDKVYFVKDEIFSRERGTKKKFESPTGIEPMASQIPGGRSIH